MNREQSIIKLRELVARRRLVEARNLSLSLAHAYPQDATIWRMRGDLHLQLDEFDSAIECTQRIIMLLLPNASLNRATLNELYRTLGTTYYKASRVPEAINAFDRFISAEPNNADVHAFRAICRLLLGDFQRGWPEYEWRLKTQFVSVPPEPRWDGGSLENKVILIESEQGHGDTIQFVRYVRDIKAQGGTVILRCQPSLHSLLAGCAGVDQIVNQGDLAPPYDVGITLLSLPGIFRTSLATIPAEIPYLQVPQGAGARAVTLIAGHEKVLRVGLVWAGTTNRSLTLSQFSELLAIKGIKFFSLQKGDAAAEFKSIVPDTIIDLSSYLGDFADTAAVIQALDLVISVDTAVAHLAGALGRPVWTLLPFAPDWRWMLDREDSPWYPTMRLFRQPAPRDWSSVVKRVSVQLKALGVS